MKDNKAYAREWWRKNSKRLNAKRRACARKRGINPRKKGLSSRDYYAKNRDRIIAYSKNYYHSHKQEKADYIRRYYKENKWKWKGYAFNQWNKSTGEKSANRFGLLSLDYEYHGYSLDRNTLYNLLPDPSPNPCEQLMAKEEEQLTGTRKKY